MEDFFPPFLAPASEMARTTTPTQSNSLIINIIPIQPENISVFIIIIQQFLVAI